MKSDNAVHPYDTLTIKCLGTIHKIRFWFWPQLTVVGRILQKFGGGGKGQNRGGRVKKKDKY